MKNSQLYLLIGNLWLLTGIAICEKQIGYTGVIMLLIAIYLRHRED